MKIIAGLAVAALCLGQGAYDAKTGTNFGRCTPVPDPGVQSPGGDGAGDGASSAGDAGSAGAGPGAGPGGGTGGDSGGCR